MAIDLARSILLVAGLAMLALAAVILVVRPGRGINRALAALVAVRGLVTLMPQLSSDDSIAWTAVNMQPYFVLAVVPIALFCIQAFAGRTDPARRARAGWLAFAAIVALDVAYFLDHSLFHSLAPGQAETGALQAAGGIQYTAFGPLWLVVGAAPLVLSYLGLRLAVQYRSDEDRRSPFLLLLASGLTLGGLFDGASRLSALTALLDAPGGFPWMPWGWAVVLLPLLGLAPALLAVAVIANHRQDLPQPNRRLERTMIVLAGFAFFSGFLRLMAPADSNIADDPLVLVLLGLWRLAMPAFVAYALVRHPFDASIPSPQGEDGPARPVPNPLDSKPAVR